MADAWRIRGWTCGGLLLLVAAMPAWGVQPEAARGEEPALFVVRVAGKSGFMNERGALVIPATFDRAFQFREGLAAVQVEERWGFVDEGGKMVIEPRFAMVGSFSDGLAPFRTAFRKPWGYLDKTGKVAIEPRFDAAGDFHRGVAWVGFETLGSKLLGRIADVGSKMKDRFIDRSGDLVVPPQPAHYGTGVAGELIPFWEGELAGYVDSAGQVVIAPRFEDAGRFSDGLARVRVNGLQGYIDPEGQFVIPPRYEFANDFAEGVAGVRLDANGWGLIDPAGRVVVPARFSWIYGACHRGVLEVAFQGKSGYINRQGEWVWPPSE